jgi:acyl CoA:acetate/3-ketoacid CoA transferase beta subunit
VKLVVTTLGVFEPTGKAFLMKEIAPGYTTDEVISLTGAPVVIDPNLTVMEF